MTMMTMIISGDNDDNDDNDDMGEIDDKCMMYDVPCVNLVIHSGLFH